MVTQLTEGLKAFSAALARSHQNYVKDAEPGHKLHPASWFYEIGTLIGAAIFLGFLRWNEDKEDTTTHDPGDLIMAACDSYAEQGLPVHPLIPRLFAYANSMFHGNPKQSQVAIQEAIYFLMEETREIHEDTGYPRLEPGQETCQKIIRRVLEPSLN